MIETHMSTKAFELLNPSQYEVCRGMSVGGEVEEIRGAVVHHPRSSRFQRKLSGVIPYSH